MFEDVPHVRGGVIRCAAAHTSDRLTRFLSWSLNRDILHKTATCPVTEMICRSSNQVTFTFLALYLPSLPAPDPRRQTVDEGWKVG